MDLSATLNWVAAPNVVFSQLARLVGKFGPCVEYGQIGGGAYAVKGYFPTAGKFI